jgi:hypothetical protein
MPNRIRIYSQIALLAYTPINLTGNPLFHARKKHIFIDFQFVRQSAKSPLEHSSTVCFISSKDQLAETFTKPLPTAEFTSLRDNLNVCNLPLTLRGRTEPFQNSKQTD